MKIILKMKKAWFKIYFLKFLLQNVLFLIQKKNKRFNKLLMIYKIQTIMLNPITLVEMVVA